MGLPHSFGEYTLAIIILLTINVTFLVYHEQAHQEVAYQHGCEQVQISYSWKGGETICEGYKGYVTEEWRLQERMMQSWTEIIGYHLLVLMNAIFLVVLFRELVR